jgi:ribosomal protein S18 acetylase RimI-like enzyme
MSAKPFSVRPFRVNDFGAIEALYRSHKAALLRQRVAALGRRVLARPLLTALYASAAVVVSAQLVVYLTPGPAPLPLPAALAFAVLLHAVLLVPLALYVVWRHRADADAAVALDLGMRLQRYANASVHWHLLFVADADGAVVGWLGATFSPVHNAVQIDTLGVDVAHRRRGVARALLRAAEEAASARAVRRLDVVLRAPLASPSLAALLCADDVAPDAHVDVDDDARRASGDSAASDLPAAALFRGSGFKPAKRLEPNQRDVDAFELWRKVLLADGSEKPHQD